MPSPHLLTTPMLDQTLAPPTAPDASAALDPALRVNDVLLRHPATTVVFNAFGVDACCGGAASLADAARDVGVPTATLIAALEAAIGAARAGGERRR